MSIYRVRGLPAAGVILACCFIFCAPLMADGHGDGGRASGADCCRAARQGQQRTARTSASRSSNSIDVVSYTLTMNIDFAAQRINARCDVGLRSTVAGLGSFALDFIGLSVSGVWEDGERQVSFVTGDGVIEITPSSPLAAGEERVYAISYSGSPQRGMYFRSTNNGICYTFTEPEDSRYWFPCRDLPADKADWYRAQITAPAAFLVAGNGTLESVISNGDGTRTHSYHMAQPVSTYLISLAVSNFATISQTASGGLPLTHYVYPSHYNLALFDWANVPAMIDFYSDVYIDYPFESYGMAMAPLGGAMEHQTMTTFGQALVNGNRRFEPVVAHELAHQWWGDMVTCRTWAEIWLNEGFATYFDALFTEDFYGPEAFREQMADNRRSYFNGEAGGEGRFPIYDPEYMWGVTVYEKGAWILHMLRQVLGTSAWQEGIRVYAQRHRFGTASTPDLIAAFQDVSGSDLGWFFDQWVYQAGYPVFKYTHGGYPAAEGGYTMTIALRQVQQNAPLFRMPLEVGVTTAAGTSLHRVEVSGEYSSFELDLDGPPADVVIDPEVWALAGWTYVDLTGDVDGSGRVDGMDNSRMAWSFGSGTGGARWFAPADLNGDGVVDGQDLALLASNFGNSL
jgi:aminopeptidase N